MFAGASSQILASSYREGKGREDLGFGAMLIVTILLSRLTKGGSR